MVESEVLVVTELMHQQVPVLVVQAQQVVQRAPVAIRMLAVSSRIT
jgi:hypothetical protein